MAKSMNKKYKNINSILIASNYEMLREPDKKSFRISIIDEIEDIEINDKRINFKLIRKINFVPNIDINIFIKYLISMESKEDINKQIFIDDIRKDMINLDIVLSKLSLALANNTNDSILGAIITTPFYNPKTIIIKE